MISPCVLLIDEDAKLLAKLEPVLRRAGYRVLTATNGGQGIYLAQAVLPEVIVCNRAMLSQNNCDVRRTLAQDSQTASIPFIDLPKTLDKQELVAQVNEVIRSHAIS